jgi:hypothetical protein
MYVIRALFGFRRMGRNVKKCGTMSEMVKEGIAGL